MRFSLLLAAGFIMLATNVASAQTKITDRKFVYSGFSYFRGSAEDINLASYGEKKTPVGKTNYLARQNDVNRSHLGNVKVTVSGPYYINWNSYSNTAVNANIDYLTAAGGTASFSRTTAKSANLKLIKFSLSEGEQKKLLNSYASGARNYLKTEGGDGRFVSSVWVVMDASLASDIKSCGSVSGSGTHSGFKVTIDVSSCRGSVSKIDVPPGTTFAYGLYKVKKWNSGKTKIKDMEDDQKGLN
jgi:hypothetical protein